jgi:hypothetical protein
MSVIHFINNPRLLDFGNLINFSNDEFFDSFNIFLGSLNTIIIFFWVNHKLSGSSVSKHSNMFKFSFVYLIIYYILFIFLKFVCQTEVPKHKFLLYPDFKDSSFPQEGYLYYLTIAEIVINIFNQIFMLNFYFLIIKNLILRQQSAYYFKKKQ